MNIQYDEKSKVFYLNGNVEELLKKKVIKIFLMGEFKAEFEKNRIIINLGDRNENEVITLLETMFEKNGIELNTSSSTENIVSLYELEKIKFEKFSKQADNIRNNKCNKKEFNEFKESVLNHLKNRKLYPLQLLSAYHLAFSQNACNFSVPGSGKTSIVYGAYSYLKNLQDDDIKKVDCILIIGPLSAFYPWKSEYEECFGCKPSVKKISGQDSVAEKAIYFYSNNPKELTFISYQGVLSLQDEIKVFLKNNKVMVILDEAHKIKNIEGGIIANSVLDLSERCSSRVVLTGTPLPQGYEDLKNLYSFIWPNKNIIGFNKYQLKEMSKNPGDTRVKQLIDAVSPFFLRIKKSDLNLPKEKIKLIPIEMGEIQRKIYNYISDDILEDSKNANKDRFKSKLDRAKLIRLMQASTNPSLLEKPLDEYYIERGLDINVVISPEIHDLITRYKEKEIPKKFKKILELTKEIIERGEKVVIWTTFIKNIHDLHKFLTKNGIESKFIYGATPTEKDTEEEFIETREKIIKDFHDKNSFKVLIANPFSVSESISLHKICNNAIYLERTFNAAHFIQSKDRIHRYGMKVSPNYYYLISKNTVDEAIHVRLDEKERRMNQIIESEEIPLFFNKFDSEFSDEDIREVIRNYAERDK